MDCVQRSVHGAQEVRSSKLYQTKLETAHRSMQDSDLAS